MRYLRSSISGMLVLVLFCAVALAALTSASHAWSLVIVMLALGLIVLAMLEAAVGRGPRQSLGVGYAIAALTYLVVALGLPTLLPTSSLLDRLHGVMCPPREESVNLPRNRFDQAYSEWSALQPEPQNRKMRIAPDDPSIVTVFWVVDTQALFVQIGHCLFSVMFGFVGGLLAVRARVESTRRQLRARLSA
jgi:hypothetical protein